MLATSMPNIASKCMNAMFSKHRLEVHSCDIYSASTPHETKRYLANISMVAQECTPTSRPQWDRPCMFRIVSAMFLQSFRSLSALFPQHLRCVTALQLSPHTVSAVFLQSFRTVLAASPHCFRSSISFLQALAIESGVSHSSSYGVTCIIIA